MSARRSLRKHMPVSPADLALPSGYDPRGLFRGGHEQRGRRKDLQLCRQVERTLTYVLSDCRDEVLNDLFVESVEPAPDSTRLLVSVYSPGKRHEPVTVLTHLQQASGFMRSEIAGAIHRKKVPELAFRCVDPSRPEG